MNPTATICLALSVALAASCGRAGEGGEAASTRLPLVDKAQRFRQLVKSGNYVDARTMMVEDARRWFGQRNGSGQPWRIGPGATGPWAAWDDHFRSQTVEVRWRSEAHAAVLTVRETNDYFALLERGWTTSEIVYYFDAAEKIEGILVRATGERPPGRTEEFMRWAREHEPEELEYLMPDGEINPAGDRAVRFHGLLNRWRHAAGLPTPP